MANPPTAKQRALDSLWALIPWAMTAAQAEYAVWFLNRHLPVTGPARDLFPYAVLAAGVTLLSPAAVMLFRWLVARFHPRSWARGQSWAGRPRRRAPGRRRSAMSSTPAAPRPRPM
jgi:hypothetical protein